MADSPGEGMSEADKERAHDVRLQKLELVWGFLRLVVIGVFVVVCVALCIPLSQVLAGTTTVVNVNVALAFSVSMTFTASVAGVGWYNARKGQKRAEQLLREARAEIRALKTSIAAGAAVQPMLGNEGGESEAR